MKTPQTIDTGRRDRLGRPIRVADPRDVLLPRLERIEGCLVWTGPTNPSGYGVVKTLGQNLAHRAVWVLERGPIPEGLIVCHHCDNPPCCDVEHLFIGTERDNTADMLAKGRNVTAPGERSGMAKLTEDSVREMRRLKREGLSTAAIARHIGISPSNASRVIRGVTWAHVASPEDNPTEAHARGLVIKSWEADQTKGAA